MHPAFPYRIKGQQLWLSPDRCIFWEEERSLIVSDLHFGKTGHFRKAGIAVPQSVYREDLLRLLCQIQYFRPRQLLVVGDLFHSRENKELALFLKWREDFPDLGIRLIEGNHDILHADWYSKAGIDVSREILRLGPFAFIHDITEGGADLTTEGVEATESGASAADKMEPYFFSGHIHPGIRIRGMGKQSLQFPCFYFGGSYAVLPAFGKFTGTVSIDPMPEANVFAILPPTGGEKGWQAHRRSRTAMGSDGMRDISGTGAATGAGPGVGTGPGAAMGPGKEKRPPMRNSWSTSPRGPGSILQIQ
jgi:DNA ligase-associated metallophosphoesterase